MKYTISLTLTGPAPESESVILQDFLPGDKESGTVQDETGTNIGYWELAS